MRTAEERSLNKSEQREADWEFRYESRHIPWDRGKVSPALNYWLDLKVLTPCRILVPGCGQGYEVIKLIKRGFNVTAVDIAPTAIDALNSQLTDEQLTAKVIHADLLNWYPEQPFDAIYEQTSICALDPDYWMDYIGRLHDWLVPNGLLYALFMQTNASGGPPYHCDVSVMRGMFKKHCWQWQTQAPQYVPHPAGFHELGYILQRIEAPDSPT